MKVPAESTSSSGAASESQTPAVSAGKPGSKPFARLLKEKQEKNKQPDVSDQAIAAGAPVAMPFDPAASVVPQTSTPGAAPAEAGLVRNLVQEIVATPAPDGAARVDVQFNSKTLEGLRVQVTRSEDTISVKFSTSSQSVSQLLSRNLGQLSQALESKGLHVAPIQVEMIPPPVTHGDGQTDSSPQDGRRGGGDSRGSQGDG
ncbi:MAG: flagellar hook-length control protein FliK, partial [Acidobacteriia bacterium]|nr:flagellar hook-length control protein FliK [Terriglobia bacterium]